MSKDIEAIKNGRIVKFTRIVWALFPPDKYGWSMLGNEPQAAAPVAPKAVETEKPRAAEVETKAPVKQVNKRGRKPRK